MEPTVVFEATGHYHRGLAAFLKRSGWTYLIVNPLQAKRAKGTQLLEQVFPGFVGLFHKPVCDNILKSLATMFK
ncbi:IS110 family transposase [Paenibacillus mucilaginosus]|uniref:IS110 family transposase n=1 Tax=Paenibacillus mucilaginosus TaxID=61624 RepID=UPI003D20B298